MLGPLDYAQVAPIGFLLAEKAVVWLAGPAELALRAVPLACGLLTLPLIFGVARRMLSGWAVPYAVGLVALGIPFIYYSAQVKPYASDVAAATFVLLAALDAWRRGATPGRAWWLGAAGALLVWCSLPAVFVVAGIGAGMLIEVLRTRDFRAARAWSIAWALWAASSVGAVLHAPSRVSALDREYFRWFWSSGFMPMPPETTADWLWVPTKITWAFGAFESGRARLHGGLGLRWSWVFTAVMLLGLWALWKRQRTAALFLALPMACALAASAAGVYPFTARLATFLLPTLVLATAAGADHLLTAISRGPRPLPLAAPVALAILGGAPLLAIATALPPFHLQHLRPIAAHVAEAREPGDAIYVYFGAGQAFRYYAPRFGLSDDDVIMGRCAVGDPRDYLRQIDRLRTARRAWIVVSHVQQGGADLALMLSYLDRLGRRVEALAQPGTSGHAIEAAYGFLYDLTGAESRTDVSAETHPIPAAATVDQPGRFGCYGVGVPD